MKTSILSTALALIFNLCISAQTSKESYWFSEIVGRASLTGKSISIDLEMPSGSDEQSTEQIATYKETVGSFSTMVEAMNFMNAHGWEFVQAYMVVQGSFNRYHWVIKKVKT